MKSRLLHLIRLMFDFGRRARQDVVQIEVSGHGFQLSTKFLRAGESATGEHNGEELLVAG